MKTQKTKTNKTTTTATISSGELVVLLADLVAKEAGIRGEPRIQGLRNSSRRVTASVRFEEETQGSPAYRVGWRAIVEIVEDHDYVEEGEAAQ